MSNLKPIDPRQPTSLSDASPAPRRNAAVAAIAVLFDSGLVLALTLTGHGLVALVVAALSLLTVLAIAAATKGARSARRAASNAAGLESRFTKYKYAAGLETFAEQAAGQAAAIERKHALFKSLLNERLQPGELTYTRFLGICDAVHGAVTDQLVGVLEALGALEATQKSAMDIRTEHESKISAALALNEKALTELDRALAALGEMKTGAMTGPDDMSSVIKDLENIAARAKRLGQGE